VNKDKYGDFAPDINCHNKEDWTTLHVAANEGHFGIAQVVLDNNGEVDPKT
jgi:ankyrin repeat protein